MPYGMPSGAELRSLICNGQADLAGALQEMHHIEAGDTIDFIKNFSRSNVASIDAFLSRHERFFEIGKLCIAAILCAKEDPAKVMNNDAEDHWYQHMWQILIDGADTHNDLRRNKISFVTFNYDRSLEYFLHQSTKHTFGVSDQEAFTVVKNLKILHVYGLLGEFSYSPSQGARQYINDNTAAQTTIAAQGIKIIPEARANDVTFQTVRNWFGESEVIGFLGFGFDKLNIKRLGLSDVLDWNANEGKPNPIVIASTYGKRRAETEKLGQLLWPKSPTKFMRTLHLENTMTIRESDLLG